MLRQPGLFLRAISFLGPMAGRPHTWCPGGGGIPPGRGRLGDLKCPVPRLSNGEDEAQVGATAGLTHTASRAESAPPVPHLHRRLCGEGLVAVESRRGDAPRHCTPDQSLNSGDACSEGRSSGELKALRSPALVGEPWGHCGSLVESGGAHGQPNRAIAKPRSPRPGQAGVGSRHCALTAHAVGAS